MDIDLFISTRQDRIDLFKKVVSECPDYDQPLNLGSVIVYPPVQGDINYRNNYRNYVSPPFSNRKKRYKVRWNSKIYNLYTSGRRYYLMESSNLINEKSLSEFKCTNRFSFSFILIHEIIIRLVNSYRVKVNDEVFYPLFSEDIFNSSEPEIIINITDFKSDKINTDNIFNISIF